MQQRSRAELLEALRKDFAVLPGTNVIIGQPISHRIDHMLSGTRANIAIKVFGEDLFELRRLGKQIESIVKTVPGSVDVAMEQQSEIPFVTVTFDRLALANYGLRMSEAATLLETAFTGSFATRISQGQATVDVVVKLPDNARDSVATLENTLLTLPSGAIVPVSALADVQKRRGANTIGRENVQRKLVIMANVSGRPLVSVVDDIKKTLAAQVKLPSGYHVEYGGQFESAQSAGIRLMMTGGLSVVGIFVLLVSAFGSARDAGLVMVNLPLALIGGIVGVWLTGEGLTIAAVIGFITLFGIATRNGIILVDHVRQLQREYGLALRVAIYRGSEERLVPILMTALATALALVPLALAAGEPGSEIQAPMAIVILWGLLGSTALNMLVVPAMLLTFSDSKVAPAPAQ
jgi:Cu/Ag efflux pump CusA